MPEANNPDRSRILWFAGHKACCPFRGGEWRWGPGNDDCSALPSSGWTKLADPDPEPPFVDLFCTSHAPLGDGRIVLAGGNNHDTQSYGEKRSRVFVPGSGENGGSWDENPGDMSDWRWYPTATTLRDGRVLVTGGDRYPHHRVFGGKRGATSPPASPSWGDTLSRFAPVENGYWDNRVLPLADPTSGQRPDPRYEHSGVEMAKIVDFQGQVYFGGIGSNGQPLDDAWLLTRNDNILGADYTYQWKDLVSLGTRPPKRSDHAAAAALGSQMVIYGGLNADGTPRSDVWRLYKDQGIHKWEAMVVSGVTTPSARCGAGAVYDETALAGGAGTRKRMIVFGGVSAPGQSPSDDKVWELRWDVAGQPNQATWYEMTLANPGGPRPSARYWHTLTQDPGPEGRYTHSSGKKANIAWLYGGALGSTSYSAELWALWILDDGTVDWQRVIIGPSTYSPGPRARHSVALDPEQGNDKPRLYVYGGENAGGSADAYVYKLDPRSGGCWLLTCVAPDTPCPTPGPSCGPTWSRWDDYEHALIGHTMLLEFSTNAANPRQVAPSLARVAETLDTLGQAYQKHANANLYRNSSYPLTFVVPGGLGSGCRVLSVGREGENTYYLDIPDNGAATGWQLRSSQTAGFGAAAAVMYRPGRVMIAGGTLGASWTGLTKSVNTTIDTAWRASASMLAREHHNLVLLPDGKVLVVGGDTNSGAVKRPQIWDPDASSGAGAWTAVTGASALTLQPRTRNYHSTAILLPDGRVLSAGGESVPSVAGDDKYFPEIFCPPYLFKSDGTTLAPRPQITGAPTAVAYRKTFTVCTPDPTRITRVCLIRPGATTHGFDQNQRYIPLNFVVAPSGPPRLFVTAPASPDSAPPGNYLLFLTGAYDPGTSTPYPDVPSIAKWVKLKAGLDVCDAVAPGTLAVPELDIVGPNELWFTWTATGDDESIVPSGNAQEFDLRANTGPINNDNAWNAAIQSGTESIPGPPGSFGWGGVSGLLTCTQYHVAVRARDDNTQLSGFHATATFQTSCGGGGGGFSAQAARPEEGAPAPMSAELSAFTLMVETSRAGDGGWRILLRRATAADGMDPAAGIVVDREDEAGRRDTLGQIAPGLDQNLLGICSLRDRGRVALPGVSQLQQVMAHLRHGPQALALTSALHSRLGALGDAFVASGGSVELLADDVIELTYQPVEATQADAAAWYVLVLRQGTSTPSPFSQRPRTGEALPQRFALYPNEPNPTGGPTLIRFDLPRESPVKLEVFDLLGRRMTTVFEATYPAGRHAVTWDLRATDGVPVRPGVYVCRLVAGAFVARSKVGVLP